MRLEYFITDNILKSVILAPKNDDSTFINTDILNRIPAEQITYHSYDNILCDDDNEINSYPVEFLNSLTLSGLPPHKLVLKVNCIVLLIRNLNTRKHKSMELECASSLCIVMLLIAKF